MKVLITGASGMLGRAMVGELDGRGHAVAGMNRSALDVTLRERVRSAFRQVEPEVVVQCAAYTDVDGAEAESEKAHQVNELGARIVAEECQKRGALFVYPSTDYVFSGVSSVPWKPGDVAEPVNAYGRSKLAGEGAAAAAGQALIVRTSWLFGSGGRNFVDTISRLAARRARLEVVNDQVGLPTWTGSLATVVADLIDFGARGIFHACDAGEPVSWFHFAREILGKSQGDTPLVAVSSEEHPRAARRPRYSVLDCSETERVLGKKLPGREWSLGRYLGSVGPG